MPRLDHINITARDGKAMVQFLETVLEAREGERPPFKNPGHWVYVDGIPAIHIDCPGVTADFPQGMVNHVAFGVWDYEPLLERVKSTGFEYHIAGIPGGVGQIFVHGPEGLRIELQYARRPGADPAASANGS